MRRFHSGMFKDTSPADQPKDTYRYAMNAVLNGTLLCIQNEHSNEQSGQMPVTARVCGTIPLTDGRTVLFIDRAGDSEIGIHVNDTYTTVLALPFNASIDQDLGFDPQYPITGISKVQSDGDVIIYWRDSRTNPRTLNLTRQLLSPPDTIYGFDSSNTVDRYLVDRLNLFPHSGPIPHVALNDVVSGGGCLTGSYQLAIGYEDTDLVQYGYVSLSNPVPIVEQPENVTPIEAYDGSKPGVQSGKSIVWRLTNLNTDLRYLTLAVVQRIDGAYNVLQLPRVEMTSSQMDVVYTGHETVSTQSTEVLVQNPEYLTAGAMEQLDSALYMGDLTSQGDLGLQKYVNAITTESVVKVFDPFDPFMISEEFLSKRRSNVQDRSQGYRDPKVIDRYRSFMRDEVYSLYLVPVLKSGKLGSGYHIPGRQPLQNISSSLIEFHDASTSPVNEDMQLLWNMNDWHMIGLTGGTTSPKGYFYQWFDFSHLPNANQMNYWHNVHEFYPDTSDFIATDAQTGATVEDMRGKNVRLHRFPGNRNPTRTTVIGDNASSIGSLPTKTKVMVHWYWFGGLENNASLPTDVAEPVLTGMFPTEDWVAAQAFQDDIGNPMCTGCIDDLTTDSVDSCYPPTNTVLKTPGFYGIFGCTPDSSDDIEFVYDTQLQVGTDVVVGWHSSYASGDGCNLIAPGTVTDVTGDGTVTLSTGQTGEDNWPAPATASIGGWVAWAECQEVLQEGPGNQLEHRVQALGFKLSDLKIPISIAKEMQGFRIYYAKRTHENRTILGQAPIHPMGDRFKVDPSGCDGGGRGTGLADYLIPGGQPAPTDPDFATTSCTFHDFYLLNRTPSLAQATHLRLQYVMSMFNFKGHVEYYKDAQRTDISDPDNKIYSCWKPEVITSFHLSGAHTRVADTTSRMNWLLVDRSKTYIYGNTILEATHLGFDHRIYNIGGNTRIALKTERILPYLPCGASAGWRDIRSDYSTVGLLEYTDNAAEETKDGCMLYLANLHAYKTDVYSPVDKQELVWTGYEVLGADFDRYVVNDDGSPLVASTDFTTEDIFGGDTYICRYGYRMTQREEVNRVPYTYPNKGSIDHKSVISTIVECSENINLRHVEMNGEPYFPGASLKDVLRPKADVDLTYNPDPATGKMRYNEDYSAVNDLVAVQPYSFQLRQPTQHPTRVIRSDRTSSSLLTDNYRYFRPDQSVELNNRYGKLWKLTAYGNLLIYHMEDAVFVTKGKQKMNVSEGQPAYVGSGDIFEQEPDVLTMTDGGYLGTRSKLAALVTPEGYFFVDNLERRVFLMSDSPEDLSSQKYGLFNWFRANLPYELEEYGVSPQDSPITGMGMTAVWDTVYKRILLTKRDLRPTQKFKDIWIGTYAKMSDIKWSTYSGIATVHGKLWYRAGTTPGTNWTELEISQEAVWMPGRTPLFTRIGWTLSFQPQRSEGTAGYWASFHDYVPYLWSQSTDILSFSDIDTDIRRLIWKHNAPGFSTFYGTLFPTTIEAVETSQRDSLFYNFSFHSEFGESRRNIAGFTSFIAWTADNLTSETELEYLVNLRRIGSGWHVNDIRDMSAQSTSTSPYYVGPFTGNNIYNIPGLPVTGTVNTGSQIRNAVPMFNVDGQYEVLNTTAIDTTKPWYLQSKMGGKYMAVRLINDNVLQEEVNLYSINADNRPQDR